MTALTASERTGVGVKAAAGAAILAALVVVGYWGTFDWLHQRYAAPGSLYGHGPLVPLVTAFLLWRDRRELRAAAGPGSWWALPVVALGLLLHLCSAAVRIDFGSGVSLLLLLPALVWLLGGLSLLKRSWFALAFLVFAIPVPLFVIARASLYLKVWVIDATAAVFSIFGTKLVVEGSFLVLPEGGQLLVEEECCGLRSLIGLIALGVLMAGTARSLAPGRRLLLLLLAAPLALLANLARVSLLTGIGVWRGPVEASRWHDPSSYAVYALAITGYVLLERLMAPPRTTGEAT